MKSILEKLGRVPKYGVAVLLAAACCLSASADCTIRWDESAGGWYIDCAFGDSFFVPGEDFGGGGSGSGGCTNCTAMSPADCEAAKSSIISTADDFQEKCVELRNRIQPIKDAALQVRGFSEYLKAEGDSFVEGKPLESWGDDANERSSALYSTPQSSYLYDNISSVVSPLGLNRALGGVGSIYNYYNESVGPILDDILIQVDYIDNSISSLDDQIDTVYDTANAFYSVANGMNCSACSSSGGTSGGGGTSGSGTTPSGCPCSEFINAVKSAVDNCKYTLDEINTKVGAIKTRLEQWDEIIKQIKNDVYSIRQTTDRMDDFFRDDTEVNFKKLIEHVITLSNAVFSATVKLPPNLYWTEYTNATQFLDDSGSSITWLDKGRTIETQTGDAVIDFGEYQSLNWFQRMEFLVGRVAGIFSPTNAISADFTEDQKAKLQEVEEDDLFNEVSYEEEKGYIQTMISKVGSIQSRLNPFKNVFSSSYCPQKITILPDVSVESALLGNTFPTVEIDLSESGNGSYSISDVVTLSANITSFLWFVLFALVKIVAIYRLVLMLFAVNRWFIKFFNSWISTMFSGGGR